MNSNLTVKRIYIGFGTALLVTNVTFYIFLYMHGESLFVRLAVFVFSLFQLLTGILFILCLRRKLILFSESLNSCIDDIVSCRENIQFDLESETLIGKFSHKLKRLYEIMQYGKRQLYKEKQSIQEIISDISHQVKTPVTNLKIYNSTLLEHTLGVEKEHEFHVLMESQIDKLGFLMQAMVKMSRMETGVIMLNIACSPIYDTIGLALSGIVLPAEKKNIEVSVNCDSLLFVPHDKKWTAEALFNILDNAVKYTPSGGRITVTAEKWEMAVKIDIADTGKGIPEQHYAQIFKRFYRESDVSDVEGVGIGLYLCREIITKQGGCIQVKSKVGSGSVFSVFLPLGTVND